MTERLRQICDEIRSLDPDEQAHVLELLADLGAMPDPETEMAWRREAQRRFAAIAAEAKDETAPATSREAINSFLKRK